MLILERPKDSAEEVSVPREIYRPNDRIKALIYEVNKTPTGLQIVLSRTHTEFRKTNF